MRKFNTNQRKAVSDLFVNLSAALISITIITPVFSKISYDFIVLISIFSILIISLAMIILSIYVLK